MSTDAKMLLDTFSRVLRWERRKRREQICVTASCCALAAALLALPFYALLRAPWSRWAIPIAFFSLFAPVFGIMKRWRREDSARALALVDRLLRLEERAITAWELIERKDFRPAAQLVLKQAAEKLKGFNPAALLRRTWQRHHYLALPLLALWLGLMGFEFDRRFDIGPPSAAISKAALKLREFSRELQERARNEGLRESLSLGKELEKVAQKGIDAGSTEEDFKKELAAARQRIDAMKNVGAGRPSLPGAESQQNLRDLKAELEAARQLLQAPQFSGVDEKLSQQWRDRLASLPQLKRQFEQENSRGDALGQNELRSFLERLDKQATGELDRRTLLEAQEYLDRLMRQGQGARGDKSVGAPQGAEQDESSDGEQTQARGNLPGKEPGKNDDEFRLPPEFRGGAPARVKGSLGEGESSSVVYKAKPLPGKSELPQEDVIARYRRQAEAELNSERVPEALKETIKNYFMSLGQNETRN